MKKIIAIIGLLGLLFSAPAHAQHQGAIGGTCQGAPIYVGSVFKAICSWNMHLSGPCTSGEITWSTPPGYPALKVLPWEVSDITITNVTMSFFNTGDLIWAEVGNANGSPDIMVNLQRVWPRGGYGESPWPSGTGMAFYSAANNPGGYMDLHVACSPTTANAGFNAFVTIYYTVP